MCLVILSEDVVAEQHLGKDLEVTTGLHVVLMGRVSVIFTFLFCCVTTDKEKHVNEKSFVVNPAKLKC